MERYTELTKERLLNVKARINEASVPRILTFLNEDGTAHDISAYDFEVIVKKIPNANTNLFKLTVGDGLTVTGAGNNKLQIEVSQERAEQTPNTYFWRLFASGEDHTWLNGDWEFFVGKYDGVTETDTITITENGEFVTITITSEGITQSELDAALALKADLISRVQSVVSAATVTPDADEDDGVKITAQAEALILANPSGTPTEMQGIVIRIKDDGTARAITYGNQYREIGTTLPTTTVIGKTIYIAILYNSTDLMWDVIGVKEEV